MIRFILAVVIIAVVCYFIVKCAARDGYEEAMNKKDKKNNKKGPDDVYEDGWYPDKVTDDKICI